ncbi:hypothetical protein BBBOND_0208430 [Babesia bigemina]|uniref:Uncharacterized protein n=1 Tax=Babesia bigemina TaxID=5866 RepID=A0A061D9U7_BABBI|nr:hypothetical protein BBBOND_0208430 [Babesia bigemina]CDR95689.1 hypothetical protein BBBOND_0208430 [Babesia bigemina]|eukprot:XP_012767875.1 hypothetical protein BBBOND_0208430 [Babesia bigemina]
MTKTVTRSRHVCIGHGTCNADTCSCRRPKAKIQATSERVATAVSGIYYEITDIKRQSEVALPPVLKNEYITDTFETS